MTRAERRLLLRIAGVLTSPWAHVLPEHRTQIREAVDLLKKEDEDAAKTEEALANLDIDLSKDE